VVEAWPRADRGGHGIKLPGASGCLCRPSIHDERGPSGRCGRKVSARRNAALAEDEKRITDPAYASGAQKRALFVDEMAGRPGREGGDAGARGADGVERVWRPSVASSMAIP
jgi:hypothetical protein